MIERIVLLLALALGAFGLGYSLGIERGRRDTLQRWGLPVGDGKADDTAAVQRLIGRAPAVPSDFFPESLTWQTADGSFWGYDENTGKSWLLENGQVQCRKRASPK